MCRTPFFETLHTEITDELEKIKAEESNNLRLAERSVQAIKSAMERMRQFIVDNPFLSEGHEIHFFKNDKPMISSKLAYFLKLYRIESWIPVGSLEAKLQYLQGELQRIDQFFATHREFYHYFRAGASFLDELYFIRGKQVFHYSMDIDWVDSDPSFSTGYDSLLAKLIAEEQLIGYLNNAIHALQVNPHGLIDKQHESEQDKPSPATKAQVQTPFRASEVYVFLKSLIDSQAIVNHTYKSFFEMLVPGISNMQQKSFTPSSLLKYSDKVDMDTRENVKRLLQKMIRNVDNY